ncbi:hypothetical protein Mco01_37850 [Microbispora corallina]|uniref:histidine kinase n=1 Tax=Microbispora corallina TaxID=83302 RepID=A0ABQ4G145_9ACTN|nr:histidine kinase [Microbispora corallina]GIH40785.1 hypothetical protein Mco01_37850 [Microbispora corallina]
MNAREWAARLVRLAAVAGLGAVFAAALAVQAYRIAHSWGGGAWRFDCVAGLVVCVIALARRRDLGWAAVAGLAVAAVAVPAAKAAHLPGEPGLAMTLALSVLLGSAIRVLRPLAACAVAAGGLAVAAATAVPPPDHLAPVTRLYGAAWLAALAAGLGLRLLDARRRAAAERVRRDERLALARELHDVVAHHITGIVVQAQGARIVARRQPEKLEESLAGIEAAGSEALTAMRRVVGLLRDAGDAAPATPGPERLGELVSRFDGHFDGRGPAVSLRLPDGEGTAAWPPEVTSTVYRVVQESLTNITRHARHARSATVTVAQDGHVVTVEVVDDAPPGPVRPSHRGGYGLVGMRERLEALGGTLRAGPRAGAGWAVLATLPVPAGRPR